MHVAIPLYPRFTALDAVGPYTVFAFVPGWRVTFVAAAPGPVTDDVGSLTLHAEAGYADLARPDIVMVPGGAGTLEALGDRALVDWITEASRHTRWTTSVCSGSFLLGAAGLLAGRRATTHWGWLDRLTTVGAVPVSERIVHDGDIVTAAGVSAGIDMALFLVGRAVDDRTAQAVQLAMEYDPQPPYRCGSPATAPDGLTATALSLIS
ncbi:DJ-1/PfpI family protein [Actinoplanes xinjiangensis]|uniref:DJ-1/PfpI family protein n=1 Tax=Actinoplanes xinjiangensis TaxID=512350 RepID=A0A316FBC3_9ACTN|nr:DJ-1/PfpI family protein [Actinoplanes xinjiangensis]PWK45137.1 DJ-1/PfpI family protein [Actinoplanes xinjiangensis]GIF41528.1 glutamine amidotransferase [Actinoplanes xinjiangensis]